MNQDQVIKILYQLNSDVDDFIVTFTGKKSRKVDGLYKPENREIILHNRNFNDDNALIYTAIHEFAHHIQFTRSSSRVSSRTHSNLFWDIFHKLLFKAEEKGIYVNLFRKEQRFIKLTARIKELYFSASGRLMKEFGGLLMEAYDLCVQYGTSFEDYVDRELQLHRSVAKTLMKVNTLNIDPDIGYENMKIVASIREPEQRELAETAFIQGQSPDMVRAAFFSNAGKEPDESLQSLLRKKEQIEKNIEKLTVELAGVEQKISEFSG